MKHLYFLTQLMLMMILVGLLTGCAGSIDSVRGGYMAQSGDYLYVKRDYPAALMKFQEAANLNDPYACYRLYVMNQYGQGTPKDTVAATRMLEKAASLGNDTSQVILGSRLLFSKEADRARGVRLLEASAARENRYAYEYLAWAYQYGLGVEKNAERAQQYLRLAKAQGSALGSLEVSGAGVGSKRVQKDQKITGKAVAGSDSVDLVKSIQMELKEQGYYPGKVDGLYGPMTRKSIERFQQERGYPVNPVASQEVLNELRRK